MRFDVATVPEVLFGRLADSASWKQFEQRRLPAYEIPDVMRQADTNLRYTPIFELRHESGLRHIRIGPHVLSYHQLAPYVGWAAFKPELTQAVDALFAKSEKLVIRRLGFRYVNALRAEAHGIASVADLDLKIAVAGVDLTGNLNINFTVDLPSEDAQCTVRVATKEFVQGTVPDGTSVGDQRRSGRAAPAEERAVTPA